MPSRFFCPFRIVTLIATLLFMQRTAAEGGPYSYLDVEDAKEWTWRIIVLGRNQVRFHANKDCQDTRDSSGRYRTITPRVNTAFDFEKDIVPDGKDGKHYTYASIQIGVGDTKFDDDGKPPNAAQRLMPPNWKCAYPVPLFAVSTKGEPTWLHHQQESRVFMAHVEMLMNTGRFRENLGVGYCLNLDVDNPGFTLNPGSEFYCSDGSGATSSPPQLAIGEAT